MPRPGSNCDDVIVSLQFFLEMCHYKLAATPDPSKKKGGSGLPPSFFKRGKGKQEGAELVGEPAFASSYFYLKLEMSTNELLHATLLMGRRRGWPAPDGQETVPTMPASPQLVLVWFLANLWAVPFSSPK